MLEKIELTDIAGFSRVSWDFLQGRKSAPQRILIFGLNGTGKTTVSQFLRRFDPSFSLDAQLSRLDPYAQASLWVSGVRHQLGKSDRAPIFPLVFNTHFVLDSLYDRGDFVYVAAGAAAVVPEIQRLDDELSKLREVVFSLEQQIKTAEKDLENQFSSIASQVRSALPFLYKTPQSYTSKHAEREIASLASKPALPASRDEERDWSRAPNSYMLPSQLNEVEGAVEELDRGLRAYAEQELRTDSTEAFKAENDLDVIEWILTGKDLHRKHSAEHCLFCEALLRKDWMDRLRNRMDKNRVVLSKHRKNLAIRAKTALQACRNLKDVLEISGQDTVPDALMPIMTRLTEILSEIAALKLPVDSDPRHAAEAILARRGSLEDSIAELKQLAIQYNNGIREWEKKRNEYAELKRQSVLWMHKDIIQEKRTRINELKADISSKAKVINELEQERARRLRALEKEAEIAERTTAEVRGVLANATVEVKWDRAKSAFRVLGRDGTEPRLSDGERTVVAFCYWKELALKYIDAKQVTTLVVDDPLTSTDREYSWWLAERLGSLIRRCRTGSRVQVLVLTHNEELIRHIGDLFSGGTAHCMQLETRKRVVGDEFVSELVPMSCWLAQGSEYYYLFERAKAIKDGEQEVDAFGALNGLRRLLEAFLDFQSPSPRGKFDERLKRLSEKAEGISEQVGILLRFLHPMSHGSANSLVRTPAAEHVSARELAKATLHIIRKINLEHYEGMCRALKAK